MNALDRKILAALENDGRLTVTELAEQVGLSLALPSPRACAGRVWRDSRLPCRVGPDGAGAGFFVAGLCHAQGQQVCPRFRGGRAQLDNVIQAQRLFGDPDYLLQVVVRDLPAYQRLYDEHLTRLPGVLRMTSTLVMKHVVTNRPLTSAME